MRVTGPAVIEIGSGCEVEIVRSASSRVARLLSAPSKIVAARPEPYPISPL
jgi:hypothetical protein